MRIKKIAAAVIAIILIISLAGCEVATKSVDTTKKKGSVYWLNIKPEIDEGLQALAKKYKEKKGVDVKIITPESGTYYDVLATELTGEDPPTMFVLGNDQAVAKWQDYALNLRDTAIEDEVNNDTYNKYSADGKLVSMGYCYECFGIIVNADLIEMLGYSMDDIKDFESLRSMVEYIHQNASWMGFDAFSSCGFDADSSWNYTAHLANLEYFYEARDAGGWDECPASIKGRYTSYFKNLYDLVINNSTAKPGELADGDYDPLGEFTALHTAFCLGGSWDYNTISEQIPNAVMIPYYCGIEGEEKAGLNCGTENCWAVNSKVSAADQKATQNFMLWLITDPEVSVEFVDLVGVIPFRASPKSENGFLKSASKYYSDGRYVMDWDFTYQPNTEDYRANLAEAMKRYNADQSEANWELVSEALVDGWAEQYAAANN